MWTGLVHDTNQPGTPTHHLAKVHPGIALPPIGFLRGLLAASSKPTPSSTSIGSCSRLVPPHRPIMLTLLVRIHDTTVGLPVLPPSPSRTVNVCSISLTRGPGKPLHRVPARAEWPGRGWVGYGPGMECDAA